MPSLPTVKPETAQKLHGKRTFDGAYYRKDIEKDHVILFSDRPTKALFISVLYLAKKIIEKSDFTNSHHALRIVSWFSFFSKCVNHL